MFSISWEIQSNKKKIRLWLVRRSQTRRTNTNEQDTYITVCKILNTKNTETQTDQIIHVINHIRTCRKQISAKLRTADIFALSRVGTLPLGLPSANWGDVIALTLGTCVPLELCTGVNVRGRLLPAEGGTFTSLWLLGLRCSIVLW